MPRQLLCGSPDNPLRVGDIEIPCYVLDDERRVIIQYGMMTALDMSQGTAGRGDGDRLTRFVDTNALKSFVDNDLRDVIKNPIKFRARGSLAYGYEATVLADLCDAVLSARSSDQGLHYQQEHIAIRCELLVRSFAKLGIIALVDEATGYQYIRQRDALEQLLEDILSDELRRWVKTFPPRYFKELCRLRNIVFRGDMKLPQYFGHLTNDVIYRRLAPRVLEELQKRNPAQDGRRRAKQHQWLSEDIGHPRLIQHLGTVIGLMKISKDWDTFKGWLDKAAPVYDDLPLLASLDDD